MYDWANSVYYTIISVIFAGYFVGLYGGTDTQWGFATSIATLISAFLAPIMGAVADYRGMKKKLFTIFLAVGLVFTATLIFFNDPKVLVVCYLLSHIGILGTILFYDSFLTDITTPERMDKISSWGFAMGYIGGSTIPLLLMMVAMFLWPAQAVLILKLSIALTVLWWFFFSIPFLKNVEQKHSLGDIPPGIVGTTFKNIGHTVKSIIERKGILLFIIAYFFYIDGVGTVISMSTPFAARIGFDMNLLLVAVLFIQIVACIFSIITGKLSEKMKPLTLIMIFIVIYFAITLNSFIFGHAIETTDPASAAFAEVKRIATIQFWANCTLIGFAQGGIQSISRSFFGKIIPPERSNEYFGFFDIFGKFATFLGPLLYSIFTLVTGQSAYGMFSLAILFVLGFIILFFGRKTIAKEERTA
jgi:UMF1 family MFS transporter